MIATLPFESPVPCRLDGTGSALTKAYEAAKAAGNAKFSSEHRNFDRREGRGSRHGGRPGEGLGHRVCRGSRFQDASECDCF